jgi:hypothetical protein
MLCITRSSTWKQPVSECTQARDRQPLLLGLACMREIIFKEESTE